MMKLEKKSNNERARAGANAKHNPAKPQNGAKQNLPKPQNGATVSKPQKTSEKIEKKMNAVKTKPQNGASLSKPQNGASKFLEDNPEELKLLNSRTSTVGVPTISKFLGRGWSDQFKNNVGKLRK